MELVIYADGVKICTAGILLPGWYAMILGLVDLDELVVRHGLVFPGPEDVGLFAGSDPFMVVTEDTWSGSEWDCSCQYKTISSSSAELTRWNEASGCPRMS